MKRLFLFPRAVCNSSMFDRTFLITQIKAGFVRVSVDGGDLPDRCERQECSSLGL